MSQPDIRKGSIVRLTCDKPCKDVFVVKVLSTRLRTKKELAEYDGSAAEYRREISFAILNAGANTALVGKVDKALNNRRHWFLSSGEAAKAEKIGQGEWKENSQGNTRIGRREECLRQGSEER